MSVGMSVPGVWDAARQHKKRAALTDKQLRDTYESLKRNNWSRPETARRLLVGEPVLNARIRMLKRLGLEVPEPVLPRRNPANKKSRRFSVAELNEAHRALVDNAWDRRTAAEELGVSSDRMYNLVGALKRLGFKVEEGPLDPKSAGQSTPSAPLIINPGRVAEVLEAVFYQPGSNSVPREGRGIPQLKAVELGKQKLAVLLRVKPGSVAKEVVAAFKVLRDHYRNSPDPSLGFETLKLIRLVSHIRHDTGDEPNFYYFLSHVIPMCDAPDKVNLSRLLKFPT